MWKSLEERNLAIIETVMQELGVSDIEELPAKVIELKAAAQQRLQSDGARFCPACHALLEEHSVYCDNCGTDTPRR
jgi:hypothetical protein